MHASVRQVGIGVRALRLTFGLAAASLWCLLPRMALAVTFDLREGATEMSRRIQSLHHMSLGVCVVVGIIVFGAMAYSVVAHRRSRRPTPARFHENTLVEIAWTAVPALIIVGMAVPATMALVEIEDSTDADLSIVVTGSQWKWHYRYLESGIAFYSNKATPQAQIDNLEPKGEHYLLDVDQPLVLPANRKVRFLTTSDDVIHSWWAPDLAVKQDAIPGFINETWARTERPGMYRGQCAELCGKGHAFMPVVVEVLPEEEFGAWINGQRQAMESASAAAVAARSRDWSMDELLQRGEKIFLDNCAECHQRDGSGQGSKYPALAASDIVNGPIEGHLDRVMNGKADTEMQAWAPQLSDLDLAAVITYERNSFGNDTGDVIQPMTVYRTR